MGGGEDAGGGDLVGVLAEVPVRQRQHRVAAARRTARQQATSFAPKMLFKKRARTRAKAFSSRTVKPAPRERSSAKASQLARAMRCTRRTQFGWSGARNAGSGGSPPPFLPGPHRFGDQVSGASRLFAPSHSSRPKKPILHPNTFADQSDSFMLSFGGRNSCSLATAIAPLACPRGLGEGLGVGPQVLHPQGLPEPRDGSRPPGGHGPGGGGKAGHTPTPNGRFAGGVCPGMTGWNSAYFERGGKGKGGVRGMQ